MKKAVQSIKRGWLTSNIITVCMIICIVLIFVYSNVFINSLNIQNIELTKDELELTYIPTLTQSRIIISIVFIIPAIIVVTGIVIGVRRKIHK